MKRQPKPQNPQPNGVQGQGQGQGGQGQQRPPPQGQTGGAGMIKSPSGTSTGSNASTEPKVNNASLFNMFGTAVTGNQPAQSGQQQPQQNQQPASMQKQVNPGTGTVNTAPKNQQDSGFADFWANSTNKQGQTGQTVQQNMQQQPKVVQQVPPPIQTQPQPIQPPINPNANKTPPQPDNKGGRATTFNQLFGLGPKS